MANLNLIPSPALHPHLLVSLPTAPDAEDCRYHLSLSFPDSIFVDRDEIKDLWDKGGGVAWSLSPPEIDIERPVRGDQEEAVRLYIEVASTVQSLDIPLHARYLRPNSAGREEVQLFGERGEAVGGWACSETKGSVMPSQAVFGSGLTAQLLGLL